MHTYTYTVRATMIACDTVVVISPLHTVTTTQGSVVAVPTPTTGTTDMNKQPAQLQQATGKL